MAGEIPLKAFENIPIDELREFFKDRGITTKCVLCNHDGNIAITEFHEHLPVVPFTENPGPLNLSLRMPIYITICNNCGHTLSYNRFVFEKWRLAKKEKANEAND